MSLPFAQIPETVWLALTWFTSDDNATLPDTAAVRAAVGLGLLYGGAVNWALRRQPGEWSRVWITHRGLAALLWREEHPPKGERDEQFPPEGTQFEEANVPPEFREGCKHGGAVLTAPYLGLARLGS